MILANITLSDLGELAVGIALVAGAVIALVAMNRKTVVKIDDNPAPEYRKAPKRYNHDATQERFVRIEDRLDGHDAEMDELRKEHNNAMGRIERSLGRIEGQLGTSTEGT